MTTSEPGRGTLAAAIDTADSSGTGRHSSSTAGWCGTGCNRTASAISSRRCGWCPSVAILLVVLATAPALRTLDAWLGWRISGLDPPARRRTYQTVITLTLSFVVLHLRLAAGGDSGRQRPADAADHRDDAAARQRCQIQRRGCSCSHLVFAVMALNRVSTTVNGFVPLVRAASGLACMAAFLFLIDYAARLLRPVSVVARVGDEGLTGDRVLSTPSRSDATADEGHVPCRLERRGFPDRPSAGHVRNCAGGRTRLARGSVTSGRRRHRMPVPGRGLRGQRRAALFALHGGATGIDDAVSRQRASPSVPERTMEQDPMFAFRILVDIGLKALSPGHQRPDDRRARPRSSPPSVEGCGEPAVAGKYHSRSSGQPRVILHTPNWEDFVSSRASRSPAVAPAACKSRVGSGR